MHRSGVGAVEKSRAADPKFRMAVRCVGSSRKKVERRRRLWPSSTGRAYGPLGVHR